MDVDKTQTVKLTYFKPASGKYYSCGYFYFPEADNDTTYKKVEDLLFLGIRPGLTNGFGFIVLIEPEGGIPALSFANIKDEKNDQK